jgi:hypothetical protein
MDVDESFTLRDHSIQESLWKLFQAETLTDVTIVVFDGSYSVYLLPVCANSDTLHRALSRWGREARKGAQGNFGGSKLFLPYDVDKSRLCRG